jgi:hypothetical protein
MVWSHPDIGLLLSFWTKIITIHYWNSCKQTSRTSSQQDQQGWSRLLTLLTYPRGSWNTAGKSAKNGKEIIALRILTWMSSWKEKIPSPIHIKHPQTKPCFSTRGFTLIWTLPIHTGTMVTWGSSIFRNPHLEPFSGGGKKNTGENLSNFISAT